MREIKFRAWASGKMYTFDNREWLLITGSGYIAFSSDPGGLSDEDSNNLDSEDFVLMQFTGLSDKNGVEVYEGDVVKMYPDTDNSFITKIIFHERFASFEVATTGNCIGIYRKEDIEVIGNIHANPELL